MNTDVNVRYCRTRLAFTVDVQSWSVMLTCEIKHAIWTYTIGVQCWRARLTCAFASLYERPLLSYENCVRCWRTRLACYNDVQDEAWDMDVHDWREMLTCELDVCYWIPIWTSAIVARNWRALLTYEVGVKYWQARLNVRYWRAILTCGNWRFSGPGCRQRLDRRSKGENTPAAVRSDTKVTSQNSRSYLLPPTIGCDRGVSGSLYLCTCVLNVLLVWTAGALGVWLISYILGSTYKLNAMECLFIIVTSRPSPPPPSSPPPVPHERMNRVRVKLSGGIWCVLPYNLVYDYINVPSGKRSYTS